MKGRFEPNRPTLARIRFIVGLACIAFFIAAALCAESKNYLVSAETNKRNIT